MAIRLTRYIHPECFIADLAEKTKEDALRKIVHVVAERGLVEDEGELFAHLMAREIVQSTAIGNGIALPHCIADEVPELVITLARSLRGLEFGSFDGKPIHLVFLLIGGRQEHSLHLKALARIAMLIKRSTFVKKILSSTSVLGMAQAFEDEEPKAT